MNRDTTVVEVAEYLKTLPEWNTDFQQYTFAGVFDEDSKLIWHDDHICLGNFRRWRLKNVFFRPQYKYILGDINTRRQHFKDHVERGEYGETESLEDCRDYLNPQIRKEYLKIIKESSFGCLFNENELKNHNHPHTEGYINEHMTLIGLKFSIMRYLWECPILVQFCVEFYKNDFIADESFILAHLGTMFWFPTNYSSGHGLYYQTLSFNNISTNLKNFKISVLDYPSDEMHINNLLGGKSLSYEEYEKEKNFLTNSTTTLVDILRYSGF